MIKSGVHERNIGRFPQMGFPTLSDEHLSRYFRIVGQGIVVNSHLDLLKWMQGEMQYYLPHEIMLAVWGEGEENSLRHDLVSALPGVRTNYLQSEDLLALQQNLYGCWVGLGRVPFRLNLGECIFRPDKLASHCAFGRAIYGMQSLLIHGINDNRGGQDCLYIIFSSTASLDNSGLSAIESLLPYLDTALRRVAPLPSSAMTGFLANSEKNPGLKESETELSEDHGLSKREDEILDWVKQGKSNAEIGSILGISPFTVKNHMRRIFKKLAVNNRIQAASKSAQGRPD